MLLTAWEIRKEDLSGEPARDLVRLHLEGMHAHSPSGGTMHQALLSSLLLPGTHPIRPNMAWNSYPQSSHTYSW